MSVALRTHADIAQALRTLGISLTAAQRLTPARTQDPALAQALVKVLEDICGSELERLRAAVGDVAPASPRTRARSDGSRARVDAQPARAGDREDPRLDQNVPAVAMLLRRYGVRSVVPRPFERVLVHAARVHEILASRRDPDKLVRKVMAADLRRHVFLLEGIARLYERRYDEAAVGLGSAKALEDALGRRSATRSNLAYAREVNAPPKVLEHLLRAKKDARRHLKRLLIYQWMPDKHGRVPALTATIEALNAATWHGYVEDKEYLRGELVRPLAKVSYTEYDLDSITTGIHELRRQLRWFPIYTEAVNGLVQLDPTKNPVPAYEPMLGQELATSKYVEIPDDGREVQAIRISKSLYRALLQLSLDLGDIKDAGEPVAALREAYVALEQARDHDDACSMVRRLTGRDHLGQDFHVGARRLYSEMKGNRLVESLAEQVNEG